MRNNRPPLVAMVSALVVSGACGLALQLVWMRQLRLTLGSTTEATATVLAVFMGGLGLGTAFWGRRVDRHAAPWRLYAGLELGVAAGAALSPWWIALAESWLVALGGAASLGNTAAIAIRLAIASLVFGLPAFLMGGTFPAAVATVSRDDDRQRGRAGAIYAANTLGAVAGCWAVDFWLLESLGVSATLWLACGLLVSIAGVIGSWRFAPSERSRGSEREVVKSATSSAVAGSTMKLPELILVSALVGAVFFLMELVWFRMLAPLLGGTTYSFGAILAVVLAGIGLGGAFYSLVARRLSVGPGLLAATCALEAGALGLPWMLGDFIALETLRMQVLVSSFGNQVLLWSVVAAVVVGPAALVAGFQFPLMLAIVGQGREHVGADVGRVYAANTLGAIFGSLLGGFWLLPAIGAVRLWFGAAVVLAIVAVLIARPRLVQEPVERQRAWRVAIVMSLLGVIGIWGLNRSQGPTAVWRHAGIGAGRAKRSDLSSREEREFVHSIRRSLLWEADGRESSVAVMNTDDGISFVVNGKSDGNAVGDAQTQVGLGILGPLLHPEARSAFVVGLGTGETAGWLADVGKIERVEVVELEPAVFEMARRCEAINRHVLEHPEVIVRHADARERLQTSTERYDLIVSEPSNPYRAGVSSLYTREFYRSAAERLAEGGLFLQWLQAYEVDERTVRIVLSTLREQFSEVEVWQLQGADLLLVARRTPGIAGEPSPLTDRDSTLQEALGTIWQVADLEGVASRYVAGPSAVDQWLEQVEVPINTDDVNSLEYAFARTLGNALAFDWRELRRFADGLGESCPESWKSSLDSERLFARRIAFDYLMSRTGGFAQGAMADEVWQTYSPEWQRWTALREAFALILQNDFETFLKRETQVGEIGPCPIWDTAGCLIHAALDRPLDRAAAERVRAWRAVDATAIEAIVAYRAGRFEEAEQVLLRWCALLRETPWASPETSNAVFALLSESMTVDRQRAATWFKVLETRWCAGRFEERRKALRYMLAEQLGDEAIVEALEAYEPWVPWKEYLLVRRAEAYRRLGHPAAKRAQRELTEFADE